MNLKNILVLRRMALSMTLAMTLLSGLAMTIPARADVGGGADRNRADRETIARRERSEMLRERAWDAALEALTHDPRDTPARAAERIAEAFFQTEQNRQDLERRVIDKRNREQKEQADRQRAERERAQVKELRHEGREPRSRD